MAVSGRLRGAELTGWDDSQDAWPTRVDVWEGCISRAKHARAPIKGTFFAWLLRAFGVFSSKKRKQCGSCRPRHTGISKDPGAHHALPPSTNAHVDALHQSRRCSPGIPIIPVKNSHTAFKSLYLKGVLLRKERKLVNCSFLCLVRVLTVGCGALTRTSVPWRKP